MNDSTPEIDYSTTAWGVTHQYSLANGSLGYQVGGSDVTVSISLECSGFTLRPRWQTHRYFRAGLAAFFCPFFGLSVIYAKEHTIADFDAMLYVNLGIMVVGLALLARFRPIYRAHLLRTGSGDELLIYRDPNNLKCADDFISQLNLSTASKTISRNS